MGCRQAFGIKNKIAKTKGNQFLHIFLTHKPPQAGRFLEQLARKPDAVFVHWRLATNGWFA
jgi:hypothetical protein